MDGSSIFLAVGGSRISNDMDLPMMRQREQRLKMLLSYHYYKKVDLAQLVEDIALPCHIFMDSGAFSAKSLGEPISIKEYMQFLRKWLDHIDIYANLDVIGDAKGTMSNQRIMESEGFKPLPVFHTHEPITVLRQYAEQYDYIALGGMVGKKAKQLIPWLAKCFKLVGDQVQFHGFGLTSWKLLKMFPFRSVDSSSWTQSFRFGQIPLFDERYGRWIKVDLKDAKKAYRHQDLIRSYGFSPNDIGIDSKYDRAVVGAISAMSWFKAEKWLNNRKKKSASISLSGHQTKTESKSEVSPKPVSKEKKKR